MQIWDTAGQECYRAITRSFYRNAGGILIVYDITTRSSFDSMPDWIGEVKQNANPDAVIFLVGNQLDLVESGSEDRAVTLEDAQEVVKEYKLAGCLEASAKTAHNIEQAFTNVAKELFNEYGQKKQSIAAIPAIGESLNPRPTQKKKKSCC